jgi:Lrp/AsnC family leucine-responsive transcriptional regulator
MLDDIDKKILAYLQENARIPSSTIAKKIGMANSAVSERMRKLEERGVISGYEARLDVGALDMSLTAYIFVRTNETAANWETADELIKIPQIQEVHNIAGEDCYLVKTRVRDTRALGRLLRDEIGRISTVVSTKTTIVLETFKETSRLPIPSVSPKKPKK